MPLPLSSIWRGGWNTAVSSNLCGYQNGHQVHMHEKAGRRDCLTTDYLGNLT